MSKYNDMANEGGEGFNPEVDSFEAWQARQDKRPVGKKSPISWVAPANFPSELAGKTLTGGTPEMKQGKMVVKFDQQFNGDNAFIGVDGKSDLKALVDAYFAVRAEIPTLKTNPDVDPLTFFN